MKTNEDLQRAVQDAIKGEPLLNAAEIGVTVNGGIVSLTGIVDSYAKKAEAEAATKKVIGVQAVVENIVVHLGNAQPQDDYVIAREVVNSLTWIKQIPSDKLVVKVEEGWVTLEGELNWSYQKEAATIVVNSITSAEGLTNNITTVIEEDFALDKQAIERALVLNATFDERGIQVDLTGTTVCLRGGVQSRYQKDEAGRIAWAFPGVSLVTNELTIN